MVTRVRTQAGLEEFAHSACFFPPFSCVPPISLC
jgi:hypothetical protein